MRKFVFIALAFVLFFTGCSNDNKQKSYTGGSFEGFSNEVVSKDDRTLALDRLKSVVNKNSIDSVDNNIKLKDGDNTKNTVVAKIETFDNEKMDEEHLSERITLKFSGSALYVSRETTNEEQWYYNDDSKSYEVYKNGETGKVTKSETSNTAGSMMQEVIDTMEKSLEFENIDSDNYYLCYMYTKQGKSSEYEYSASEDKEKSIRLTSFVKMGFVSSFFKEMICKSYSGGVDMNYYVRYVFDEWGSDISIPEIPEVN